MTVFIHFMIGGIAPVSIYVLQNIPSTANLGDSMRWWFVWIPTFCVGEGIVWSATYIELNLARIGLATAHFKVNQIDTNVYALVNLGGNYIILAGTSVLCIVLLFVIEMDIFQKCANCSCRKVPKQVENVNFDDDVIAEEHRVNI